MAQRFTELQHARPFGAGQPTLRRLPRAQAIAALAVLLVLVLAGCGAGDRGTSVSLPPTPVVTLRPTWAVVAEPYLRLRAEPSMDAPISGHLRRGDVARIEAIGTDVEQVDGEPSHWYRLESGVTTGWTLDRALEAYGSEYRARNAADRLREGE